MPTPQGLGRYYKRSRTYTRFKELLKSIQTEPPTVALRKVFELMEKLRMFGCFWKANYAELIIEKLVNEFEHTNHENS